MLLTVIIIDSGVYYMPKKTKKKTKKKAGKKAKLPVIPMQMPVSANQDMAHFDVQGIPVSVPVANPSAQSYAQPKIDKKEDMEKSRKELLKMANKFKDDVTKKYGDIVKAVVLFGSLPRGDFHKKSDIDLLVIVDDTGRRLPLDQMDFEVREIGAKISQQIVTQPVWTLTEFWDMARIGHPLLYTIVRDGWALYDTGFFIPVRRLLELGKIPTTLEAVEKFMESVPKKITRVETAKLFMIAEDLYYSMLNSSQAVLMYIGLNPPAPKYTPDVVKEHLVDAGLLESEYLRSLEEVIEFRKKVEHKEINDISGADLDAFIEKTKRFVSRMEQLLMHLQKNKKANMVQKNYEIMIKAVVSALKTINRLPPDPKDLPSAVKHELIDAGKVNPGYADIFKRVVTMRKMLDEERIDELPQRDVELMREYVRRFIRDLSPIIEPPTDKKKGKKKA